MTIGTIQLRRVDGALTVSATWESGSGCSAATALSSMRLGSEDGSRGGGSGTEARGGAGDAVLVLASDSSISSAMAARRSRRFLSLSSNVRASSAVPGSRKLLFRSNTSALCSA